jgi:cytochrome c peroxidase
VVSRKEPDRGAFKTPTLRDVALTAPYMHDGSLATLEDVVEFYDQGRWDVTKQQADRGAFKTPTLRDVSKHAPYMHDGSHKTLKEVVEFYNQGGTKNPNLDAKMKPLGLTSQEVDALVAFMEALDGEGYRDTPPKSFPQ